MTPTQSENPESLRAERRLDFRSECGEGVTVDPWPGRTIHILEGRVALPAGPGG